MDAAAALRALRPRAGGALELIDATLPGVSVLAALFIYARLAADIGPTASRAVELGVAGLAVYAVLRHLALFLAEPGDVTAYVHRQRFGATIAAASLLFWGLGLLVPGSLTAALGLVGVSAGVSLLLQMLLLLDLFSTSFARSLEFLARHLKLPPPLLIVISFAVVILVGTVFLMSPRATAPDHRINFVDALFTATSATCVTGLAVRDTGTGFTPFGHAVILMLAQIGGLGLMTFASFFSLYLGQGLGIKQGLVLRDALNLESLHKARPLLIFMLKATFAIELAGAAAIYVLLTPYWKPELTVFEKAWASLFHSISAFCNAGFSTFPRELVRDGASLEAFSGNWAVLTVFSLLIIIGGLGFMVLLELLERRSDPTLRVEDERAGRRLRLLRLRAEHLVPVPVRRFFHRAYFRREGLRPTGEDRSPSVRRRNIHALIVIRTSIVLLIVGFVGIAVFESGSPLAKRMSTSDWLLTAAFQSVTSRTAGFNSVPYGPGAVIECHTDGRSRSLLVGARRPGDRIVCPCGRIRVMTEEEFRPGLSDASLFLMISLMFIGASPGSTGGGVKTITVAILLLAVVALLRRREEIEVGGRALVQKLVTHAAVIVLLAFSAASAITLLLTWTEVGNGPCGGDWRFLDLLFETVSAVATVGLSTGVTGSLSTLGRVLIIGAMFFGRIGPLTLVLSLAGQAEQHRRYQYPKSSVMIG